MTHAGEVFSLNSSAKAIWETDHVIRSLAGVTRRGRPLFLKIAYNGPKALTELVSYDPQLIVGILGGSAGTTYDTLSRSPMHKRMARA
jgi:hypothetical protein